TDISAQKVPTPVSKYIYENYKYAPFVNQSFSAPAFRTAALSWYELGGTYGKVFYETEVHYIKWAATANILLGTNGTYVDVGKLDYTVIDSASIIVHNIDMTMAQSMQQDKFGSFFAIRGIGAGTTLGVTYMHKRKQSAFECNGGNDHFRKYQYRVG